MSPKQSSRRGWLITHSAALRFLLSHLFNLRLPREGKLVHVRDPEQFKRILQQHIAANGNVVWL